VNVKLEQERNVLQMGQASFTGLF